MTSDERISALEGLVTAEAAAREAADQYVATLQGRVALLEQQVAALQPVVFGSAPQERA